MKTLLLLVLLAPLFLFAQQPKQVRNYYDGAKKRLHEDYFVTADGNKVFEGPYKRYYPNGKLEMEGAYRDGKRSGTFMEYFPNGQLQRKITYRDGLRHGPVEVLTRRASAYRKASIRTIF